MYSYLVECDPQVDMDELARILVNEDIRYVPVAKAHYMSDD